MKFLRFNRRCFFIALILFVAEVLIALYVHDDFVRPFVGDVIVVWFIYYAIKMFVDIKPLYIAIFTLLFAFGVETAQYLQLINTLDLQNTKWAQIVIGTSFSWWDMLCYVVGFIVLFLLDKELRKNRLMINILYFF